jgi:hypothetical protein
MTISEVTWANKSIFHPPNPNYVFTLDVFSAAILKSLGIIHNSRTTPAERYANNVKYFPSLK